jgi:PAS domain S-box-containing protein
MEHADRPNSVAADLEGRSRLNQILLDNMPCVALLLRPFSREIVAANQAAIQVGAVPGTQCFATWIQRDHPCPWCLAPVLWETGQAQHLEIEDSGMVWDAYWIPVAPDLYMHYAFDITERKRAEAALIKSEARLRSLYETVQAGLILLSADGTILHANRVACDIIGMEPDEIIGKTPYDASWQMVLEDGTPVPGDEHPSMITIRTGKPIKNVVRGLFANDPAKMRWLLVNTEPILDPQTGILREVTITFQDITAQKQTQAALGESLSLYKTALESTADGLLVVDLHGRMVSWNRKFADMWRIPEDILNARDDQQALAYILEQLHDPQGFLTKVRYLYDHPEAESIDTVRFKDGRVFERHSMPQYLEHRIMGRVWSFRDVTSQVQAEEALRDNEQFLTDVFNSIQEGLSIIDPDLNIIRTNPAMEHLGYWQPLAGEKCYEAYHGRSSPCEVCPTLHTLRTGEACREIVKGHPVNQPGQFMEVFTSPLQDRTTGQMRAVIEYVRDVTDRLAMEQALKESERNYRDLYQRTRLIIDTVPDYIWSKDMDDQFVLVNQAMCREFLMTDRADGAVGKTDRFFAEQARQTGFEHSFGEICVDSDAIVKATKTAGRFLESGKVRGQHRVLDVYKAPLLSETGEMIGTVGCGRDVTREHEIEEALRQSEEKYRLLVENIPAVVFKAYGDWSVDFVDDKVEALTGYPKADFDSRKVKWCDLIPAEDFYYAKQVFIDALKTNQSYIREHRLRRKDGELIWVQCRGQIFCNAAGEVDYISGMSFDITARKRAQEALQDHATFMQTLIDTIPTPIFYKNAAGIYLGCNRALADFLGLSKEAIIGKTVFDVYPLDLAEKYFEMDSALFRQPGVQVYEYSMQHADGTRHDIIFNKATFSTADGAVAGLVGVMSDITERKHAEAERLRVSKLESVAALAGGIAHDFNNILTAIIGNISLAMLVLKEEEYSRERLLEAERACQQAQTLSRQFLTFARGGAPIKQLIALEKLIIESGSFASTGSPVRCEFSFLDDLWAVEADPGQISQVFHNLVINAVQSMPTGGMINVRGENLLVEEGNPLPLAPGRYVKISIQDQGLGMPADYLPKIFDPYVTTKQTGSGLGLATAYSIVKHHQGHIAVESTLGAGSTFHVYLPACERPLSPAPAESAAAPSGKGKILVMDDEAMVRNILEKMLHHLGYEVELAGDGAEAVAKFIAGQEAGEPFDAVILDLTVPGGMGGKEAMERLLKIEPRIKAIVSSGYFDAPIMAEFAEYGFLGIIAKPYKIADLGKVLQEVLS